MRFVTTTALAAMIACFSAGCCATVPRADKYFHRDWDTTETLRQFQYAVETEQYDIAHECLTDEDQAEFTLAKFRLFLWLGRVEALRDVRARDAIIDARYDGQWNYTNEDETACWLELEYENEERRVGATLRFHFKKVPIEGREFPESGEWRLDLYTTALQFIPAE